jgi:hypothetical protein
MKMDGVGQAYLKRTRQTIEAATFQPAQAIIHEAGFFD